MAPRLRPRGTSAARGQRKARDRTAPVNATGTGATATARSRAPQRGKPAAPAERAAARSRAPQRDEPAAPAERAAARSRAPQRGEPATPAERAAAHSRAPPRGEPAAPIGRAAARSRAPQRGEPTASAGRAAAQHVLAPADEPAPAVTRSRALQRRRRTAAEDQALSPISAAAPTAKRSRTLRSHQRQSESLQGRALTRSPTTRAVAARSRAPQQQELASVQQQPPLGATAAARSRAPQFQDRVTTSEPEAVQSDAEAEADLDYDMEELEDAHYSDSDTSNISIQDNSSEHSFENFNRLNENMHSTEREHRLNPNQSSGDPTERLVNAPELTLATIRESSLTNGDSKLINRMTSAKSLPYYNGDPLEWIRFKQSYELSTELGKYSDKENVSRLFMALKGQAREATKALFAAGNNASDIMKILEMRFGNTKLILDKIIKEVRDLPHIDSRRITLIEFATKLKNAVGAIKALNHVGYLYSPELTENIVRKLPSVMMNNYVRYVKKVGREKPDLERMGESIEAGILPSNTNDSIRKYSDHPERSSRPIEKSVFATGIEEN